MKYPNNNPIIPIEIETSSSAAEERMAARLAVRNGLRGKGGQRLPQLTSFSSSASSSSIENNSSIDSSQSAFMITPLHDPTHLVTNQVPPLGSYNLFTSDAALCDAVEMHGGEWATQHLQSHGELMGSEQMLAAGEAANRNKPELKTHNATGHRVDTVDYHPAYHELMASGIRSGATAFAWNRPQGTGGAHVARAALMYMQNQAEAGHCCPLVMTFAAVPALRAGLPKGPLRDQWIGSLCSDVYDPRNLPLSEKRGATVGMSMTEKQGGSDVQTNTTTAVRLGTSSVGDAPEFALRGHKWFTSAPMSDGFLTLARIADNTGGSGSAAEDRDQQRLSCFLVPRWLPNGERNEGLQFQRLKDKLGDRSNASSEVEYRGARGFLVGEAGKGINAIVEMVHHTRLDCALGSAGGMRRAVAIAANHAASRQTFGKTLAQQPLMRNVLVDLMVETEASTHLVMRTAKSFEESETADGSVASSSMDDPRGFSRLLTAITKYFVCKQFPLVAYEAMECLGGNGYVEDFPTARIYRQAPLNAIWEGSGNVLALDVLRTLAKVPSAAASFYQELATCRGDDRRLDAHVAETAKLLRWASTDATPAEQQAAGRAIVAHLARAMQGATLVKNANCSRGEHSGTATRVAEIFCASRLGAPSAARCHYGTLSGIFGGGADAITQADLEAIIERNTP